MLSKNQLKYIQSLGQKKSRDEEQLFIAEGPKIINELLNSPYCKIRHLYGVSHWINENKLQKDFITEISEQELQKISQLKTPNAVFAIAEYIRWEENLELRKTITLVLDNIQDPGNMGTIVRLADWFGIKNIICSYDCVDIYNPKVVQASMGSIIRIRVEYTDLKSFVSQHDQVPVYTAELKGHDITKMGKIQEGMIVVGNESKGISKEILALKKTAITIPGGGKAESLNAAVATGIILSHLV